MRWGDHFCAGWRGLAMAASQQRRDDQSRTAVVTLTGCRNMVDRTRFQCETWRSAECWPTQPVSPVIKRPPDAQPITNRSLESCSGWATQLELGVDSRDGIEGCDRKPNLAQSPSSLRSRRWHTVGKTVLDFSTSAFTLAACGIVCDVVVCSG